MKKLLFVFALAAFTACGGNEGTDTNADSTSVTSDTSTMGTGAGATDTTGAGSADTSRSATDTAAMSTPH